eukprot:374218_1
MSKSVNYKILQLDSVPPINIHDGGRLTIIVNKGNGVLNYNERKFVKHQIVKREITRCKCKTNCYCNIDDIDFDESDDDDDDDRNKNKKQFMFGNKNGYYWNNT